MSNKKSKISPYAYPGIKRNAIPDKFFKKTITLPTNEILEIISRQTNVSISDILSDRRFTEMVKARHIFCGILRMTYKFSLTHIGTLLQRDHTTIISAVKQFNNRKQLEENFRNVVENIELEINLKK